MKSSKRMQSIVERIKKRRKALNLSYQDLADITGFGKSTLQRYETGSINTMPVDRFEKLAEGLEIEPHKLMGWNIDDILKSNIDKFDTDLTDICKIYEALNADGRRKLIEYSLDLIHINSHLTNDGNL